MDASEETLRHRARGRTTPNKALQAYPASKFAAKNELRQSGLSWSIQRFGFVYGDKDGHLEAIPKHAVVGRMHPANIVDEAPISIYEIVELVGETMEPSSEPLANPWHLYVDGSLARSLGFQPTVRTVFQAAQEKLM